MENGRFFMLNFQIRKRKTTKIGRWEVSMEGPQPPSYQTDARCRKIQNPNIKTSHLPHNINTKHRTMRRMLSWNQLTVLIFLNCSKVSAFGPLTHLKHHSSPILQGTTETYQPSSHVGFLVSRNTYTSRRSLLNMSKKDEDKFGRVDFSNLGKPIDIDSLISTDAAGPMFSTCGSNTGLRAKANDDDSVESEGRIDMDNLGEPIELESLNPTFMGLSAKEDPDEMGGVPMFTGTIILFYSIYFIIGAFMEDVPLDVDVVAVPSNLLL